MDKGLFGKFIVLRNIDGYHEVPGCFVLRPEVDEHAYAAVSAYANSVHSENLQLASDLRGWLIKIDEKKNRRG